MDLRDRDQGKRGPPGQYEDLLDDKRHKAAGSAPDLAEQLLGFDTQDPPNRTAGTASSSQGDMMQMAQKMLDLAFTSSKTNQEHCQKMYDMMSTQWNSQPTAAPQPTPQEKKAPKKHIHPEYAKHIDQVAKTLEKDMLKRCKAQRRVTVAQRHLDDFADGKYPPTVNPLQPPMDQPELALPWTESANGDHVFSITFPRGTLRADAMSMAHLRLYQLIKQIDLEALNEHAAQLQVSTSKETYMSQVKNFQPQAPLITAFGLDSPDTKFILEGQEIDDLCIAKYQKALEAAEKFVQSQAKREDSKQQAQQKAMLAAATQPPEMQLTQLIEHIIDRRIPKEELATDEDIEVAPSDPAANLEEATKFLASIRDKGRQPAQQRQPAHGQPKNYESPPVVVGQNTRAKQEQQSGAGGGKGWPESKSKGNSKGKPDGKGKGKPDGKSKSKGKGNHPILPDHRQGSSTKGKSKGKGKKGKGKGAKSGGK